MQPSEWLYRIRQQRQVSLWALKHQLGMSLFTFPKRDPAQFTFCTTATPQLPELSWSFEPDEEEVNRLLNGQIGAFTFDWNWSPDPLIWHRAPDTNQVWPRRFFHRINYREGNPYGDIRIAWEPSRLQHLLLLALIIKKGPAHCRSQTISSLEAQVLSWDRANPFPIGIHYISAMECALRMLALCHTIDMVRQEVDQASAIWSPFLRIIHSHASCIAHRVSQHSSRGNHTVAEGAGLIYAGLLFPEFSESSSWLSQGLSILEESATSQILADGGGAEQSFGYLRFITDLFGLVVTLLQHHQRSWPSSLQDAHCRGINFLRAFAEPSSEVLFIGDWDSGYALSPYLVWPSPKPRPEKGLLLFPYSGYSLIKTKEPESSRLVFDHGPLGLPPSYGHGHADALSITLSVGNRLVLIDSGTFTYTGDPTWRRYFRGTSAHNTVVVDGMDQSVQETSFMWSHPFHCRLIRDEQLPDGSIRLLARHHGYESRADVIHWRGVFYRPAHTFLVWDFLTGTGSHTLELFWHIGIDMTRQHNAFLLNAEGGSLKLEVEGGMVTTHRGETEPLSGWQSPSYGRKHPATTIRTRFSGSVPHEFITTVRPSREFPKEDATHTLSLFRTWAHDTTSH